jgi:hypothetical protein
MAIFIKVLFAWKDNLWLFVKGTINHHYITNYLSKLSDAIVYSTIKAKNNSDGLVEKIINVLEKIKK